MPRQRSSVQKVQATTYQKPRQEGRRPRQIFSRPKKFVISLCGIFTVGSREYPWVQIANWIEIHGGTYVREVTKECTHLICSIDEFQKQSSQVKKAWNLGAGKCHIVNFDWICDSLLPKMGTKIFARSERPYTLDRTMQRIAQGNTNHQKYRDQFEENVKAGEKLVDNRKYPHQPFCFGMPSMNILIGLLEINQEADGFEHKVVLTRLSLGGKMLVEKYTLYLFRSMAKPHTFMTGAKLSHKGRPDSFWREECRHMSFDQAFPRFMAFFKSKTGIDWYQRLLGIKMSDDQLFVYTPPPLGRPCGAMADGSFPHWRLRLELRGEKEDRENEKMEAEAAGEIPRERSGYISTDEEDFKQMEDDSNAGSDDETGSIHGASKRKRMRTTEIGDMDEDESEARRADLSIKRPRTYKEINKKIHNREQSEEVASNQKVSNGESSNVTLPSTSFNTSFHKHRRFHSTHIRAARPVSSISSLNTSRRSAVPTTTASPSLSASSDQSYGFAPASVSNSSSKGKGLVHPRPDYSASSNQVLDDGVIIDLTSP